MRLALINGNDVVNVVECEPENVYLYVGDYDQTVDVTMEACGPGWTYNGSTFTNPIQTEEE